MPLADSLRLISSVGLGLVLPVVALVFAGAAIGDLREDKAPGLPRKIGREVHLEKQVGLPVAESDEEAVPRRRIPADKRPDSPLEDPLDPSIRRAARPPPIEPHQDPVLGPRPGE